VAFNNTYRADEESYLLSSLDRALSDQEHLESEVKRHLGFDRIRRQRELRRKLHLLENDSDDDEKAARLSKSMAAGQVADTKKSLGEIHSLLRRYEFKKEVNGRFSPHFEGSEEKLKSFLEALQTDESNLIPLSLMQSREEVKP
jgi:hypothetical protein